MTKLVCWRCNKTWNVSYFSTARADNYRCPVCAKKKTAYAKPLKRSKTADWLW